MTYALPLTRRQERALDAAKTTHHQREAEKAAREARKS